MTEKIGRVFDESVLHPRSSALKVRPGYGRARLWLGISAVGTIVLLAIGSLVMHLPDKLGKRCGGTVCGQLIQLILFVVAYVCIQFPFDVFGGYLLPRRFGRSFPPLKKWVRGICRGVFIHSSLLFITAVAILFAGRFGGVAGTIAAGLTIALILLGMRLPIARACAALSSPEPRPYSSGSVGDFPAVLIDSSDEGFTGGIVGRVRADFQVIPVSWPRVLGPENFQIAVARRRVAVRSGAWRRGRIVSVVFTLAGLIFAAFCVPTTVIGTAGGAIRFSLWFTLWSFAGLLVLPSFSRRGVMEIDEQAVDEGISPEALGATVRLLDDLQDGEPVRPRLVKTIFHPIPSVQNRVNRLASNRRRGYWDVARTSIYLSLAGLGLLGRAVHCNCGRPGLWVLLPTD